MGNTSTDNCIDNTNSLVDDYVNASYINSVLHKKFLIAASAPTKNTVTDFLQMIIENKVTLIIKVCDFKYNNKEQCYKYLGKENKGGL